MANQRILPASAGAVHARSGAARVEDDVGSSARSSVTGSRRSLTPAPSRRRALASTLLGAALLGALVLALALNVEWRWLEDSQRGLGFKLVTGGVLAVFLGFQWLLAFSRTRRWLRLAKALYGWHQLSGSVGPLLFYVHSTRLGFGYLAALSLVYLGNHALALAQPSLLPRLRWWNNAWLTSHIALSVLLVALAGYHAWTALYYE